MGGCGWGRRCSGSHCSVLVVVWIVGVAVDVVVSAAAAAGRVPFQAFEVFVQEKGLDVRLVVGTARQVWRMGCE